MSWIHGGGGIRGPNSPGYITLADSAILDAFGRLRVSNPTSLFDTQLQYDDSPLFWFSDLTGSGTVTHDSNSSSANLETTTADGDKVIRQTKGYFRYQPGKSQFILCTGVFGIGKTNLNQCIGYFDADNGIFFQLNGTTLSAVLRSKTSGAVVNTVVNQSDWNIDIFDGNGPSGIELDITKAQIFVIDLEWLSVGRVRIGFYLAGQLFYGHEFLNANVITTGYMTTANLPVRYEIENTGVVASANILKQICTSVISEGGFEDELGAPYTANNGVTAIGVTTRRPILSIRPKATFNSIVNRGRILPESFNVLSTGNDAFIELVYGGTLTDATFANNQANSITEADVAATAISDGEIVFSGYLSAAGQGANVTGAAGTSFLSKLPLVLNIDGANPIPLSIVVTSMNATATITAAINWRELR